MRRFISILILLFAIENLIAEETIIYGSEMNENFGISIDSFENLLIVGTNEGFAEIYEKNLSGNYVFVQKLEPNDLQGNNKPVTVKIFDDYAALGFYLQKTVYIFRKIGSVWSLNKKLTQLESTYFGKTIDISDSLLVIGAYLDYSFGTNKGLAFVYKRNGNFWNSQGQLWAYDYNLSYSNRYFGQSVTIAGDFIIVSSENGVYPFYQIGPFWIPETKIEMNSENENLQFGKLIDFDDGELVVYSEKIISFYARNNNAWKKQSILEIKKKFDENSYASSLKIDDDKILIGFRDDLSAEGELGSVYCLNKTPTGWKQIRKIIGKNVIEGFNFAQDVALSDDKIIISAPKTDFNYSKCGAVHLFDFYELQSFQIQTDVFDSLDFSFSTQSQINIPITNLFLDSLEILDIDFSSTDLTSNYPQSIEFFQTDTISIFVIPSVIGDLSYFVKFEIEDRLDLHITLLGESKTNDFHKINGNEENQRLGENVYAFGSKFSTGKEIYQIENNNISKTINSFGGYLSENFLLNGYNLYELVNGSYQFLFEIPGVNYPIFNRLNSSFINNSDIIALCNTDFGISSKIVSYNWTNGQWNSFNEDDFIWNITSSNKTKIDIDSKNAIFGVSNNISGAAIYKKNINSWELQKDLTPININNSDNYGASVAISSNFAFVSANKDDEFCQGLDCGAVYIYHFDGSNWNLQEKLFAFDSQALDEFGTSIAVHNNILVIGSPKDDENDFQTGSVYIYKLNGANWNFQEKLIALDGQKNDLFGSSVSISDELLVVGSPSHDFGGLKAGAVYAYKMDNLVSAQDEKFKPKVSTFSLNQNYPNPFNPSTKIEFSLEKGEIGKLTIFNSLGQKIKEYNLEYNFNSITWNGTDKNDNLVSNGIYFYKLESNKNIEVKKMVLLR
ncbi:MAG: T9SS C-terminal target domain-containing protein [Calditrichaeota bacterium]|nr:MAG: T9SS C-terminal target domain-containing protein [Calditrichota bacterium]